MTSKPFIRSFFAEVGQSAAVARGVLALTQAASHASTALGRAGDAWHVHLHLLTRDRAAAATNYLVWRSDVLLHAGLHTIIRSDDI